MLKKKIFNVLNKIKIGKVAFLLTSYNKFIF
jgi:hypothetical protein